VIEGLTGDERCIWLGAVWRGKVREADAIQHIKADPHSPPAVRGTAPGHQRFLPRIRRQGRRQDVSPPGGASPSGRKESGNGRKKRKSRLGIRPENTHCRRSTPIGAFIERALREHSYIVTWSGRAARRSTPLRSAIRDHSRPRLPDGDGNAFRLPASAMRFPSSRCC